MPFKNYENALQYQREYARKQKDENYDHILALQRKFYHNHLESERIRMRKKYVFKKECLRLRNILFL
jgi:hypothetical protein